MNVKELEELYQFLGEQDSVPQTTKELIGLFLTEQQLQADALNNPFKWFYEDLIQMAWQFRFQDALGAVIYANADDDAETCVRIAATVRDIPPTLIFSWISAALRTIDHVVVHCLAHVASNPTGVMPAQGIESWRYKELEKRPEPLLTAGTLLYGIHTIRNNAEHRTKLQNGQVVLVKPNMNRAKRDAIDFFRKSLLGILQAYKAAYPHLVIHP